MTEDPHARPPWPQAPWQPGPPAGHGPPPGYGPPPPGSFGPGPGAAAHPPGGPETLSYPAGSYPPGSYPDAPPDATPPHGEFSWRDSSGLPPQRPGPPIGRILLIIGAIVALLAAGVAAYLLLSRPRAATPQAPPTVAAPPAPAPAPPAQAAAPGPLTLTAAADCVSPPSKDAAGTVVAYGPEKMVDGQADTAWRCDGDGAGKKVRITFNGPARVDQVSIVPGYAKTDPADGTDRYAQNRRIAQVRYTFDDGTSITQTLKTGIDDRSPQTIAVPGVASSGMTVTVVRSVPGSAVGPNRASDRIAISEIQVLGAASG
jgi:hypothetical protein